ncbi:MAG: hypothetical protein Q9192_003301 [Flavoplaca navasiana]
METSEADARPPRRDGHSKYRGFVKAIFLCLVLLALCLGTLALYLRLFNSQSYLPGSLLAVHRTPCQQTTVVPWKLPPLLSNSDQSHNTPFVECLDDKRWKPSPSFLDLERAQSSLQFDVEAFNGELNKRLSCAIIRFVSGTDGDTGGKPTLVKEVSSASKKVDLLISDASSLENLRKEARKSGHACISNLEEGKMALCTIWQRGLVFLLSEPSFWQRILVFLPSGSKMAGYRKKWHVVERRLSKIRTGLAASDNALENLVRTKIAMQDIRIRLIMSLDAPVVRVGVSVFILQNSSQQSTENPRFLLGKRINAHGAGTWATPGGHLEFGETPETCAAREVLEETGLRITNIQFLTATNDFMPADNKHYVTLFVVCFRENPSEEPRLLEPHKCEAWEWANWESLLDWVKQEAEAQDGVVEKTLFTPLLNLVRQRPNVKPVL